MFYLDNLRLSFTFLVILHHVCLTYAADHGWYFYQYLHDPFTNLVLNVLMSVGRTWVLACFFLISGYFTPGSLDRKGTRSFIKDRFIRIGVPLAIFALLIRPTMVYLLKWDTLSPQYSYLENILFMKNAAPGPAWFLEVLLVFSLAYALWRVITGSGRRKEREGLPFPGNGAIVICIIVLAAFTFVVRLYLPPEKQIFHLRLGNYAEYVAFFFAGSPGVPEPMARQAYGRRRQAMDCHHRRGRLHLYLFYRSGLERRRKPLLPDGRLLLENHRCDMRGHLHRGGQFHQSRLSLQDIPQHPAGPGRANDSGCVRGLHLPLSRNCHRHLLHAGQDPRPSFHKVHVSLHRGNNPVFPHQPLFHQKTPLRKESALSTEFTFSK